MCIYIDDDERTHLGSGTRKARVEHKCNECERTIEPGESYWWWTSIDDAYGGGIQTEKMCAHCMNTIDLGASFTGCPRNWYWGSVHDLSENNEGSFVYDIVREHALTVGQMRAMVRCVRGYRRRWRDDHGRLLPLVTLRAGAGCAEPASTEDSGSRGQA